MVWVTSDQAKNHRGGGSWLGAHLQNLLKLFDWVIAEPGIGRNITLPEPKIFEVEVIY